MKKLLLSTVFLLIASLVSAQQYNDYVYLKQRHYIFGKITEGVPGAKDSIKVKTFDGSIFIYPMNQIQKIIGFCKKNKTSYKDMVYLWNGNIIKNCYIENFPSGPIKIQKKSGSTSHFGKEEIIKVVMENHDLGSVDVVYLKNGSIIKGIITEQKPNQSLKIQTKDGSTFVYNYSDIEKVTKESCPRFGYLSPNGMTSSNHYQSTAGFRFGVIGGINFSKLTSGLFKDRTSFLFGAKVQKDIPSIAPGIFADGAILFIDKGSKLDFGEIASGNISLKYLELPFNFGYKYGVNENFAIYGKAGLWISYLLSCDTSNEKTWEYGEYDEQETKDDIKDLDFGLGLNIGCEFSKKIQFNIGYELGLTNIYSTSSNDGETDLVSDIKNRSLTLSIAYMF
jgi:hypothetical protein